MGIISFQYSDHLLVFHRFGAFKHTQPLPAADLSYGQSLLSLVGDSCDDRVLRLLLDAGNTWFQ